jgi:hypothetical protein
MPSKKQGLLLHKCLRDAAFQPMLAAGWAAVPAVCVRLEDYALQQVLFLGTLSVSKAFAQVPRQPSTHLLPELDLLICCCWLAWLLPLLVVDGCWAAEAVLWLANTLCSRI